MRLLVCGGRYYDDGRRAFEVLNGLHAARPVTLLIHGGASGADLLARRWAMVRKIDDHTYHAHWHLYGKAAGPRRNTDMLTYGMPDLVVAFPGGRGTADMVRKARAAGVEVMEVE